VVGRELAGAAQRRLGRVVIADDARQVPGELEVEVEAVRVGGEGPLEERRGDRPRLVVQLARRVQQALARRRDRGRERDERIVGEIFEGVLGEQLEQEIELRRRPDARQFVQRAPGRVRVALRERREQPGLDLPLLLVVMSGR